MCVVIHAAKIIHKKVKCKLSEVKLQSCLFFYCVPRPLVTPIFDFLKKLPIFAAVKLKLVISLLLVVAVVMPLVAQPSGINHAASGIVLNGDDWSGLISNLNDRHRINRKFTIVHIGDSHVQPGIISDELRRALQERYGNGGRGLISPLALAGTNEPRDYLLKSSAAVTAASRLLSSSRPAGMGFTGVAIRAKHAGDEFYRVTLFHSPGTGFETSQGGKLLKGHYVSPTATQYVLREMTDTAVLRLSGNASLYGVRLLNSKRGVVVDCIGNNGATYRSYLNIDGFARQLRDFEPQLVIISLGTNEAYGNFSSLSSNINQLLTSIGRECPGVKFLLTTPLETHKRGSNRIQTGIASVRDVIVNYGRSHHVPVWDFYRVAGGVGAATRWLSARYMNSDHLHLRDEGYHYQGKLLANAMLRLLSGEDDGTEKQEITPASSPAQEEKENYVEPDDNFQDWRQNSSTDN